MKIDFIPITLSAFKEQKKNEVDAAVEVIRLTYVTAGSAQAMVYTEKGAEAQAWASNNSIAENEIPHLAAEAAALGKTVSEIAASVLAAATAWKTISARLEGRRLGVKKAIDDATTHKEVISVTKVDWASVATAS